MQDFLAIIRDAPALARQAAEAGDPVKALNFLKLAEAAAAALRNANDAGDLGPDMQGLIHAIADLAGGLAEALLTSPDTAPQAFLEFAIDWRARRLPGAEPAASLTLARRTMQVYLDAVVT